MGKIITNVPVKMLPYVLVRVNNQPVSSLLGLIEKNSIRSLIEEWGNIHLWLKKNKAPLSEQLYHLIQQTHDESMRKIILQAKRDVYNERTKILPLKDKLETLLGHKTIDEESGVPLLQQWLEKIEQRRGIEEQIHAEYEQNLRSLQRTFRHAMNNENFLQAMLMTSPEMYETAMKYIRMDESEKKKSDYKYEDVLLLYFLRSVVKTSPFSTFTSVDFVPVHETEAKSSLLKTKVESRYQLDVSIVFRIFDLFMDHIKQKLLYILNPNFFVQDEYVYFYYISDHPNSKIYRNSTKTMKLKHNMLIGKLMEKLDQRESISYKELEAEFIDKVGTQGTAILSNLIAGGVLQPDVYLREHSQTLLQDFIDIVYMYHCCDTCTMVRRLLQHVNTTLSRMPEGNVETRKWDVREIQDDVKQLFNILGGKFPSFYKNIIYHDSLSKLENELHHHKMEQITSTLHLYGDFMKVLTTEGEKKVSELNMSKEMKDKLSGEEPVNLLEYYNMLDTDAIKEELVKPRINKAIFNEILSMIQNGTEEIIDIEPYIKQVVKSQVQYSKDEHFSVSIYGQFFNQDRFVLNEVRAGYLRYFLRFLHFKNRSVINEISEPYHSYLNQMYEMVETYGYNLNLHPKLTGKELSVLHPSTIKSANESILLKDIVVKWDEDKYRIRIVNKHSNEEIKVYNSLFMYEGLLPKVIQFVMGILTDTQPIQDLSTLLRRHYTKGGTEEKGIIYQPRIEVGNVVIARRAWYIPKQLVPMKEVHQSDIEYLLILQGWLRVNKLVQQGFIRLYHQSLDVTSNQRKPVFIDFKNPLFTKLIIKKLANQYSVLIIEECLPDLHDTNITDGNHEHFVSEIQYEFYK